MFQHHTGYRNFLKAELEERCKKEPRYSLRAFAKSLDISATSLSDLLRGHSKLSTSRAADLGERLGLSEEGVARFCDMVQAEDDRSPTLRKIARARLETSGSAYQNLKSVVFRIISDWHHYAILELMQISNFSDDPKWIARRLGISPIAVENAIDRLLEVGLLVRRDERLERTDLKLQTAADQASASVRKHQQQLIDKSLEALRYQPLEQRNFTSMIMAVNPQKLDEAKIKVDQFIEELTDFLESGDVQHVYAFNTQLFRLSTTPEEKQ